MTEPEFLEPGSVQRLHDRALLAYGGIPGLKDEGMLLSALDRPQNKLAYTDLDTLDLFDLAAAYAFGLATNHAFNDGNKRMAWSACVLLLKINGVELDVPATAITQRMPLLATRAMPEPAFAAWLRTIARPQAFGASR